MLLNEGDEPTRIGYGDTTSNKLDYIIATPNLSWRADNYNCNCIVLDDSMGSDHIPVICSFSQANPCTGSLPQKTILVYKNADWPAFQALTEAGLRGIADRDLTTEASLDQAADDITDVFRQASRSSIPTKVVPSGPPQSTDLPREVLALIKRRRKLTRSFLRYRCPDIKKEINAITKDITAAVSKARTKNWDRFCRTLEKEESEGNFWKQFSRIKVSSSAENRPIINQDKEFYLASEKADVMADHLGSIMKEPELTPAARAMSQDIRGWLGFQDRRRDKITRLITMEEMHQVIKRTPNNKAPGPDEVTGKLIKQLSYTGIQQLRKIFDKALRIGYVPKPWKRSVTVMIPKPGKNLTQVNSYRPISLTSILGKLLERIITTRLLEELETSSFFTDNQGVF